jgi:hypothetical protein
MADQFMTAGVELDALKPELWSALFYPTLLQALPFNDSIARQYEGEIRALGNIVNITSFPQFGQAATALESERVDAQAITAAQSQLTINKMIVQDFIITDVAQVQTLEAANAIRDLAFYSIMKRMQTEIIGAVVPSASAPDHSIAYDSGTTLALADILEAKELLDTADVPDDGSRNMILGAAQWNDIFNITGLTSRDFINGNPLENGSLPARVLGFVPKLTTEAGTVSYFFHPIFQQLAVQRGLSTEMFRMGVNGYRAVRVNSTVLMGHLQVSDVRVVTIS